MKAKNYIFRSLIFTLFMMLTSITANSQGTIQTPMGQTVSVKNNWDTPEWVIIWDTLAAREIRKNDWDTPIITAIPMHGMLLKEEVVQISG